MRNTQDRCPDIATRFWSKVQKTADCWEWQAGKQGKGRYGSFKVAGRDVYAHRFAYELTYDCQIPAGLQLDHLCRNTSCVNPDHLEIVNNRENVLRGISFAALCAAQTHCKYGHAFTPENTYIWQRPGMTQRHCRICHRRRDRERKQRLRERKPA